MGATRDDISKPAPRVIAFALDCEDPRNLAEFYSKLLGWQINEAASVSTWVELADPHGGPTVAFQQVENYRPPTWPDRWRPQMAHLDILFDTLEEGRERALRAGATELPKPGDRVNSRYQVYADPAGHPFCIMTQTGYLPAEPSDAADGPVAAPHDHDGSHQSPPVWATPALRPPSTPGTLPLRRFVHLPTRLEPLDRLSEVLGGPRIWIKRDDCTGLAGGGNKARKLEWLIADALDQGADTVLTTGGVQSNHARQTAAAAAIAGLECELWLVDGVPGRGADYSHSGNVLLDQLFQARIQLLPADADPDSEMVRRAKALAAQGRSPYVIPAGGSTAVGARGYLGCAHEIVDQTHQLGLRLGTVVHATGSGGTQAGLAVGLAARGSRARVLGISVGAPEPEMRAKIAPLVAGLQEHLDGTAGKPGIDIDDSYIGAGYGVPTPPGLEAIQILAKLEGILLDPVYTGKAMAALIDYVRTHRLHNGDDVLFVHTGGWPALYGYPEDLAPLLASRQAPSAG